MIRSTAILIAALSLGGVNHLYAQETVPGPGTLEVYYALCEAEGFPRPNVLVS